MPGPWGPVFLQRWTQFVSALGNRYAGKPELALVHMTTSTYNGFEMQLPSSPADTANCTSIGYPMRRTSYLRLDYLRR